MLVFEKDENLILYQLLKTTALIRSLLGGCFRWLDHDPSYPNFC